MPRTFGRGVSGNALALNAGQVDARNALIGRYARRFGARVAMRLLGRTTVVGYGAMIAAEHIGVVQHLLPPTGFRYCGTCVANIPKPATALDVRRVFRSSAGTCGGIPSLCLTGQAWPTAGDVYRPGGCWSVTAWYIPSINRYNHIHSYARPSGQGALMVPPIALPYPQRLPRHLVPAIDAALPDIGTEDNAVPRVPVLFAEAIKALPSKQTRSTSYDEFDAYNPRWVVPPVRITIRIPATPGGVVQVRPAVVPGAISSVGTGKPEVKTEVSAKARAGFRMAAFASEAGDVLEVLFKSLPPDVQARYGRGRWQMATAIWNHWREINPVLLGANFAINEIGDMSTASRVGIRNELSQRALGGPSNDLWRFVNFGGI